MSPDPTSTSEAGGDPPSSPQQIPVADERSFAELVPQFFLFPLLIVAVGALVYVCFIRSAQDERPIADILQDLQSGWFQTRNQAAFELAMRARDLADDGSRFTRGDTEQIIAIRKKNLDNPNVRKWLIFALGRAGEVDLALPVLLDVVREEDDLESRIEGIRGLGLARSAAAIDPLIEELAKYRGESDWEQRLITLSALANIGLAAATDGTVSGESAERRRVVELLRRHLEDARWSIRWNTATVLAINFKDPAGVDILRDMLDRDYLREHVPENYHQDHYIIEAIRGLATLEDRESYSLIENLKRDPSSKVRNAVFTFRDALADDAEANAEAAATARSGGTAHSAVGERVRGDGDRGSAETQTAAAPGR